MRSQSVAPTERKSGGEIPRYARNDGFRPVEIREARGN